MRKCSFCEAKVPDSVKLPEGWGTARGKVFGVEFDIAFCPKHRKEAEDKLDLILDQARKKQ